MKYPPLLQINDSQCPVSKFYKAFVSSVMHSYYLYLLKSYYYIYYTRDCIKYLILSNKYRVSQLHSRPLTLQPAPFSRIKLLHYSTLACGNGLQQSPVCLYWGTLLLVSFEQMLNERYILWYFDMSINQLKPDRKSQHDEYLIRFDQIQRFILLSVLNTDVNEIDIYEWALKIKSGL